MSNIIFEFVELNVRGFFVKTIVWFIQKSLKLTDTLLTVLGHSF